MTSFKGVFDRDHFWIHTLSCFIFTAKLSRGVPNNLIWKGGMLNVKEYRHQIGNYKLTNLWVSHKLQKNQTALLLVMTWTQQSFTGLLSKNQIHFGTKGSTSLASADQQFCRSHIHPLSLSLSQTELGVVQYQYATWRFMWGVYIHIIIHNTHCVHVRAWVEQVKVVGEWPVSQRTVYAWLARTLYITLQCISCACTVTTGFLYHAQRSVQSSGPVHRASPPITNSPMLPHVIFKVV